MTFKVDPTLVNNDSKIRIDVEATARITLCDIDYILSTINDTNDVRHQAFLLESAISKTASVFQLAMKACDYFENKDFKMEIINKFPKNGDSSLGVIGALREKSFHEGCGILKSERFYPFAHIKGNGYVGIYIHKGAILNILDYHEFNAADCEYAITSEGIYKIENVGMNNETWTSIKTPIEVIAADIESVITVIVEAISDLKSIWKELRDIRLKGDGTHEYSYLNEGGSLELLEKEKKQMTSYNLHGSLRIKGNWTIIPPDGLKVESGRLTYFIDNDQPKKNV